MKGTETTKIFADRLLDLISEAKEEKGKDMRALEDEIGVSRAALSKYQNDEAEPGINAIKKIADYFKVSTDWLIGKTDNRQPENQDIGKRFGLSDDAIRDLQIVYETGFATKMRYNKDGTFSDSETSSVSLIELLNDFLSSDELLTSLCLLRGIKSDISVQKSKRGILDSQIEQVKQEAAKILGENVELLYGYNKIQLDFQMGASLIEEILKNITGYSDYERDHKYNLMIAAMESGGI